MRRLLAALVLVALLGGLAEAGPARPLPPRPRPSFIGWLLKQVIAPVVVAGAKDLCASVIRSAIVAAL
jgi:hypothetical protein